jgi:hypothetical protein
MSTKLHPPDSVREETRAYSGDEAAMNGTLTSINLEVYHIGFYSNKFNIIYIKKCYIIFWLYLVNSVLLVATPQKFK